VSPAAWMTSEGSRLLVNPSGDQIKAQQPTYCFHFCKWLTAEAGFTLIPIYAFYAFDTRPHHLVRYVGRWGGGPAGFSGMLYLCSAQVGLGYKPCRVVA
jgi:hypothetical protein